MEKVNGERSYSSFLLHLWLGLVSVGLVFTVINSTSRMQICCWGHALGSHAAKNGSKLSWGEGAGSSDVWEVNSCSYSIGLPPWSQRAIMPTVNINLGTVQSKKMAVVWNVHMNRCFLVVTVMFLLNKRKRGGDRLSVAISTILFEYTEILLYWHSYEGSSTREKQWEL